MSSAGREIPGAGLIRNPDAGHAGHFDATDEILRWLLEVPGIPAGDDGRDHEPR